MIRKNCCECQIFGDDFQRADADDPGNYTELGGSDYDVDSNELLCVTGGLLICDTAHPGGASAPQRVRRRFKRTSTSEHARVVLAEQDASNLLYASVETVSGCDVLRLFKVVGGTTTELGTAQTIGDGAPLDVWHTLEACLKIEAGFYYAGGADIFRAKVTLASGKVYGNQAPPDDFVGGDKVGIDDSANVRCDDFYFGWMKDEATVCRAQCPECRTPCLIETDSFPGGSETACKWSSGKLRVFHPELGTKHYATARFDLADGENAEIRVNMKADGSEYHWAKLALSGTTLTLTIGKTGTTLATKTGSGSAGTYGLSACFSGAILTGAGGPLSAAKASATITDGIYAGRAGTADFTYFEFQKHFAPGEDSECPNCPEAPPTENCCCPPATPPAFAYVVDLGAGGLTNNCCNGCDDVLGEYVLTFDSKNAIGCLWAGLFPIGTGGTCGGGVFIELYLITSGSGCMWELRVSTGSPPGNPCSPVIGHRVTWQSAVFEKDQCQAGATLSKISSTPDNAQNACNGTLPDTVPLAVAP